MPLQTSGAISLSNIQSEFGGSNPISISEYIRGGSLVPNTAANSDIPTSLSNISFSDFYGGSSAAAGPPDPVRSNLESFGIDGGLGNVNYEIVTGIIFDNQTTTNGEYYPWWFNDQRPNFGSNALDRDGGVGNRVYTDKIGQAEPGDTIFIEAHAYTSSTYSEYFEFYHYNLNGRSGWYRFANSGRVSVPPSGLKRSTTFTIAANTPPGNYAIAVALSYNRLGDTAYRSWRSYSLHIY
tara:strand:- start:1404 stop:2117 length:714 start_codon:yes stop_codon:yes gene_type:complete